MEDSDFLRPASWYQRWRTIKHMHSIAAKLDHPDLYELVEEAEEAASIEDDEQFLKAVGKFLESVAQSGR